MENVKTLLKPNTRAPLQGLTYLRKENCLSEFSTEWERAEARRNLGITDDMIGGGGEGSFNGNLKVMNLINNGNFLFDLKGWTIS